MNQMNNINLQDDSDLKKITELIQRNYKFFIVSISVAIGVAFLLNHYSIPVYKISASVLIKENTDQSQSGGMN